MDYIIISVKAGEYALQCIKKVEALEKLLNNEKISVFNFRKKVEGVINGKETIL